MRNSIRKQMFIGSSQLRNEDPLPVADADELDRIVIFSSRADNRITNRTFRSVKHGHGNAPSQFPVATQNSLLVLIQFNFN